VIASPLLPRGGPHSEVTARCTAASIFSSLLGVWQSVPYLFADFWGLTRHRKTAAAGVDTHAAPYQVYLFALATVPAAGLWTGFQQAQKLYAIVGAMFIPLLAVALLVLNGQSRLVGKRQRNSLPVTLLLLAAVVVFVVAVWFEIQRRLALG